MSRLRSGDSLLSRLEVARLAAFTDNLLSDDLLPWRSRDTGIGLWAVPATSWRFERTLPESIASALELRGEPKLWAAVLPFAPEMSSPDARLLLDGHQLAPHEWPADAGLPQDGTAWHDEEKRVVLSWDARSQRFTAVSAKRPGELRVESPLNPSQVLAGLTLHRPEKPVELLTRASFGRVERRAIRLPATGTLEWDLAVLPSPSLEVHVAVPDEAWIARDGFLQPAPGRSDGVTFAVDVEEDGVTTRAWSRHLKAGEGWRRGDVDLSAWLGRDITLRLLSDAGPAGRGDFDDAYWAGLRLRGGARETPDRPHIVLVDIDTLRADRLGRNAIARNTSPRLNRWVKRTGASVFTDCTATSSWTLPSTMSLMTGLHVFQHGVDSALSVLAASIPTLAGQLAAAGYETAAWVDGGYVSAHFGFGRGFDSYAAIGEGEPCWTAILDWMTMRRSEAPCFVFVQTYMVHAPYLHDDRFWLSAPGEAPPFGGQGVNAGNVFRPFRTGELTLDAREREYVVAMYDAGVRRMDDLLGEFLEGLDERFGRERLMVIITSDHGEELFDHGGLDHGRTLYEEVLRVPLIVRWPDGAMPDTSSPRTLLDVAPTLLEQAGADVPGNWPGRSFRTKPSPSDLRIAQLGAAGVAVRNGPLKLIDMAPSPRGEPSSGAQLFDLASDAGEKHNLLDKHAGTVRDLLEEWEDFRRRYGLAKDETARRTPMDAQTRRALQELGYLDGHR